MARATARHSISRSRPCLGRNSTTALGGRDATRSRHTTKHTIAPYERVRDLRGLIPMWPAELADRSPEGCLRIIGKLRRALRQERRRGLAGDWTYDLARHAGLYRALKAELAAMPPPLTSWAATPFTRPAAAASTNSAPLPAGGTAHARANAAAPRTAGMDMDG